MLRLGLRVNGSSVYVFDKPCASSFDIYFDLRVGNLYNSMFEFQLWAVGCLSLGFAPSLAFNSLEPVLIG